MNKFKNGFRLVSRSFSFFGAEKKKYILGVFLASFELALLFLTPFMNKTLIDIIEGKSHSNIIHVILMLSLIFLALVPLIIIGKYIQNTTTAKATIQMKKMVFTRIMNIPYSRLADKKMGDYLTRLTSDVTSAGSVFNSLAISSFVRFLVIMSISLVLLFINDWKIAIVGIIYSAISFVLSILLNPYVKKLERDSKLEIVNSASFLVEAIRGIPIIRIFTLHDILSEKYQKVCQNIKAKRIKYQTMMGITYGTIDFFTYSAQTVGFIIAILLSSKDVELADAVFNATLVGLMADSMLRFSTFLLLIQIRLVSIERVFEILDIEEEDLSITGENIDTSNECAILFENVSFSYNDEKNVINNLSLKVKSGENIAIVGGSGGGKSTLIKLIQAFYVPTSGEVSFFGTKDLSTGNIRKLLSYIPQECSLFDGSIAENIALGRPNCTKNEIIAVAKNAKIHDFIEALPEKYDTLVGERGSRLSGGQKQRIAIARAIIKGSKILLLDEVTAALDSETEREIYEFLTEFTKGITTITVAHRLSTIKNADRILVMEGGEIIEMGNFDNLLRQGGRFKELYDNQFHNHKKR